MGNEFVMVPREDLANAVGIGVDFEKWSAALEKMRSILARQAEQHQGEPVAWQVTWPDGSSELYAHEAGAKTSMAPYRPLYTHADPGEVERLTEQLEVANQAITYAAQQAEEKQKITDALMADAKQFRAERDTLRAQLEAEKKQHKQVLELATRRWYVIAKKEAQLAERDALLDRVVDHANFWHDHPYAEVVEAIARDYKALSASADTSAKQEFREHLDKRASEVATWPDWKQEALKRPSTTVERDDRAAELVLDWDVHNKGHGHVFPRADGVRARCGGPRLCSVCAADQVRKDSGVRS